MPSAEFSNTVSQSEPVQPYQTASLASNMNNEPEPVPNDTDSVGSPYSTIASSHSEADLSTLLTAPTTVDPHENHDKILGCPYPFHPNVSRPPLLRRHSYSGAANGGPSSATDSQGRSPVKKLTTQSSSALRLAGSSPAPNVAKTSELEPATVITTESKTTDETTAPTSTESTVAVDTKDAAPVNESPLEIASFETIAPELLLMILEPLPMQALSALSRTSKSLFRRVAPILYATDIRNHDCLSLLWGAHFSSVTTMQRALDMGAKVNHMFKRSTPHPRVSWRAVSAPTPLIAAIRMNQPEAVRFLCKAGANPNVASWIRWDRWFGFGVLRNTQRLGQVYAQRSIRTRPIPDVGTEEYARFIAAGSVEHSPFAIPVHVGATPQSPQDESLLLLRQVALIARANESAALGADAPVPFGILADLLNNPNLGRPAIPLNRDPNLRTDNYNAPWGLPGPPTSSHPRGAEEVYPWYPLNHALDAFSDDEPPWDYSKKHFEVDIVRALVDAGAEVDIGPSDISHLPLNFWVGRGANGDHTMEWIPPLWQTLWGYVPAEVTELLLQHGANPGTFMCPGQGATVKDKIDYPLSPLEALIRCRMDRGQYPTDLDKIEILLKHMDFDGKHKPLRPSVDFLADAWWNPKAVEITRLFVKHGAVQLQPKRNKAEPQAATGRSRRGERPTVANLFRKNQAPAEPAEEPMLPVVYGLGDAHAPIFVYRALLRCYQRLMTGANIPTGEGSTVFNVAQIFPPPDYVELVRVMLQGPPGDAPDEVASSQVKNNNQTNVEIRRAAEHALGADPNTLVTSPGFDGEQTPLRMAACFAENRLPGAGLARVLLRAGADPLASDSQGATALHYASQFGRVSTLKEILEYIPRAQPAVGKRSPGRTPANRTPAALSTPPAITAAIDTPDHDGWTPLHYAAQFFYHTAASPGVAAQGKIAKLLLDHGASITARTRRVGLTPLHVAVRAGNYEVAHQIMERAKATNMVAELLAAADNGEVTPIRMLELAEREPPCKYNGMVVLCPYSPNESVIWDIQVETLLSVERSLSSLRVLLDYAAHEHTMLVRERERAVAAAAARIRENSLPHRISAAAKDAVGRVGSLFHKRRESKGKGKEHAVPSTPVVDVVRSAQDILDEAGIPRGVGVSVSTLVRLGVWEAPSESLNKPGIASVAEETVDGSREAVKAALAEEEAEQAREPEADHAAIEPSTAAVCEPSTVATTKPSTAAAAEPSTAAAAEPSTAAAAELSTAAAAEPSTATEPSAPAAEQPEKVELNAEQPVRSDEAADEVAVVDLPFSGSACIVPVVWSHFFGPRQLELFISRQPERPGKFFPNVWDEAGLAIRRPVCRLVALCRADVLQEWYYAA